MVRQTTKVIFFEVLGTVLLLALAGAAILAFMLSNGPVELGMFRDDVERALTRSRDGKPVKVDTVTLQWSPAERRLFIVANDLTLMDDQQQEAGRAERAEITLDAGAIFLGKAEVLRLHLDSGWMNLRNIAPNQWSLAGDPLPEIQQGVLPQTPQEWLDRSNSVLTGLLSGLETMEAGFKLESVSFNNMEVRYFALDGSEVGRFQNTDGSLQRSATDISLTLSGEGGGLGLPGEVALSIDTMESYTGLQADLAVSSWPVSDLARRFSLTGFQDGDFRTNIVFGASVSRDDGLQQIDLRVEREAGALSLPFGEEEIYNIFADLSYVVPEDRLIISELTLLTNRLETSFVGHVTDILNERDGHRFDLSSNQMVLDITEVFSDIWQIDDIALVGRVSNDFKLVTLESASAQIDEGQLQASGEFVWGQPHEEGELPFNLSVAGVLTGAVTTDTVVKYWPVRLGEGARRYVIERVLEGELSQASFDISIAPDSLAQGYMRDSDLLVEFGFVNGAVKFLRDVEPITNATGMGRLTGNSFTLNATDARFVDWTIPAAEVSFPALNPKGELFHVTATGAGPVVTIMRALNESQLKLQESTGFDPERVSGLAEATFQMSRPALDNVAFDDTPILVQATLSPAGLEDAIGELDLSEGTAQLELTNDWIIVTGHGVLGAAPVQFTWRDAVGRDENPADLSATAILTPDVLNAFGLVGRAYLSGEIPVEMQGQIGANGLGLASFAFDLQEARIDVGEIGWVKPAGRPARATLTYSGDMTQQVSALRIESDTAQLDGDVLLGPDGRLETLTLRNLYIENRANVSGELRRLATGAASLSLTGAYLDISQVLGEIGGVGGSGPSFALGMEASVEQLRLRRGLDLKDATLSLVSESDGLKLASAKGETSSGRKLEAYFAASTSGGAPVVSLMAEDAGFLAEAFLGVDFVSGGSLDLTGTLATESQPIRLVAKIRDARLRNAPFFTQVLSLASLRGLTDTLAGEGVLFSEIEAPITIGGGRYVIDGARASGPALGLTVNGWVSTSGDGIELNGVLVPSFGVNSLLGGVPIIGDLFVGREGEGIFSITYSVSGTLEKAQVAVNPLSAVTPGILRRIFENPSDTSIPSALPVDPTLMPPTAKLPELPEDEYIEPTPGGD